MRGFALRNRARARARPRARKGWVSHIVMNDRRFSFTKYRTVRGD
jgi:hypothetical protein